MQIFVKTLTSKTISITCSPEDTAADFKLKIQNKEGIPPDQMRLIYKGKELDPETEPLEAFNVQRESTVHMILKLRGGWSGLGVGFNFASMEKGSKIGFSDNAPTYRIIGHGLNLEGCCMNKNCEAFKQLAWSNLGFSRSPENVISDFQTTGFNIGTELYKTPCPLCKESFDPASIISCGFYRCQYSYEGYQQGSRSVSKGNGKACDHDAFEYHNGLMDSKSWSSLIIVVKPL